MGLGLLNEDNPLKKTYAPKTATSMAESVLDTLGTYYNKAKGVLDSSVRDTGGKAPLGMQPPVAEGAGQEPTSAYAGAPQKIASGIAGAVTSAASSVVEGGSPSLATEAGTKVGPTITTETPSVNPVAPVPGKPAPVGTPADERTPKTEAKPFVSSISMQARDVGGGNTVSYGMASPEQVAKYPQKSGEGPFIDLGKVGGINRRVLRPLESTETKPIVPPTEIGTPKTTEEQTAQQIDDYIAKLSKQTYDIQGTPHSMKNEKAIIAELLKAKAGLGEKGELTRLKLAEQEAARLDRKLIAASKGTIDWLAKNAEKDVITDEMGNKTTGINHAKTFFKAYIENRTVPEELKEDVENAGKRFDAAKEEWYSLPTNIKWMEKNKITNKKDPRVLRLIKEHYLAHGLK